MIFARYSFASFLHHKLILCISVFMIRIQEETLMKSRENLILLLTFQFMQGKVAGRIQQRRVFIRAGNYKSGYLLSSKSFGIDPKYDKKWYSFGPFNPSEGEYVEKLGGHVFKIIAQGISGDDGNIYKYFLSTSPVENIPVEGGNFFTYKYHFRLSDDQKHVCQIYPFVDDKTISIEISNFDWDNDGIIRIFSVAKNGILCDVSGEDNGQ